MSLEQQINNPKKENPIDGRKNRISPEISPDLQLKV